MTLSSRALILVGVMLLGGCTGDTPGPSLHAQWRGSIGEGTLIEAIGVAASSGIITASDSKQGLLFRFTQEGDLLDQWRTESLSRPMHIAAGPDGRIYVPDHLNDQVVILDPHGNVVMQFGGHGTGPGQFDSPAGVAISAAPGDGSIYVADFNNHRVQKFDANGTFVLEWGEKGHVCAGAFDYPTDVAIGPDGSVYVADAYNHRVQVFTSVGEHVQTIGSKGAGHGEFDVAIGIAVDHQGRLFVADQFNHRVQVFDSDGAWLGAFGSAGTADAHFDRPNDVTFDEGGRVYIADFGNGRVQVFTTEAVDQGTAEELEAWDETGASQSSLGRWWY